MALVPDHKAFPAEPPTDLDDADTIVRTDWAAYARLDRLVNHWDRPGWDSRTRRLYWMLTFDGHHQLADRAAQCQRALQHMGLDLTPPRASTSPSCASATRQMCLPGSWTP